MRRILVVGATSAIAAAACRLWAGPDTLFFLVGRSAERLSQVAGDLAARGATVHSHVLDLTETQEHAAMLEACYTACGTIDVALVAHGTLPRQAECERDVGLTMREFANNGLSVIALLTLLAERMAADRKGCIAVISSVAGDRGRASNYVYGAAKSAVSTFCSGLRARLFRAGVHVLTVKPGFVDTPMTRGLALPGFLVASPERVARDIVRAVERRTDTLYTPWYWRFVMLIILHLPGRVFKRLRF